MALNRVAVGGDVKPIASFNNYAGVEDRGMDFSGALGFLRRGVRVRRQSWSAGRSLRLLDSGSMIVETGGPGTGWCPGMFWEPSQADILAVDWDAVPA